jgi:MraZ protein
MQLIGEFEVRVDDKGRIMIPVALRKQLPPEMQDRFVLNRGLDNCVSMTPYPLWIKESARVNGMNSNKKAVREYQRMFANGATDLILDTSGRMLIPKHLQDWASVGREVVISSYGNKIEIWAKEKFKVPTAEDAERYSDLAEEIFGNDNNDGE